MSREREEVDKKMAREKRMGREWSEGEWEESEKRE